MPVEKLQRFADIFLGRVFGQVKPFVKGKRSKLQSVLFIGLDFSDRVSAIVVHKNCIDYGNKYTVVMQHICDGQIIIAGVLHNDLCFTRQRLDEVCKPVQVAALVNNIKGFSHDFSKRAKNSYCTFSFGHINAYGVHKYLSLQ